MNFERRVLEGRYQMIREIGEGGMGRVYYAEDLRLRQEVALKEILNQNNEPPEIMAARVRAFQREAHLLAGRIKHHAIPRVIDYFQSNGLWYIVMDYIDGESLEAQLQARGEPFAIRDVLFWTDQLLEILNWLHSGDPCIVHRDIKPSNIKVKKDNVYLLDFGLAKQLTGSKSSVPLLTLAYASPEQMENKETTPVSDLYSVGATMYCLLTNTEPVSAFNRSIDIASGQADPLRPLKEIRTDLPSEVSDLVMSSLSLRVDGRPHRAQEMRSVLSRFLSEKDRISRMAPYDASENAKTLHPDSSSIGAGENAESMKAIEDVGSSVKVATSSPPPYNPSLTLPSPSGNFGWASQEKAERSVAARSGTSWRTKVAAGIALLVVAGVAGAWLYIKYGPSKAKPKLSRQIVVDKTEQAMEKLYINDYEGAKALAGEAIDGDQNYGLANAIYGDAFWDEDETEREDSSKNPKVQVSQGAIVRIFEQREPQSAEDFAARSWASLASQKWNNAKADVDQALVKRPAWPWAMMQTAFVALGRACGTEEDAKEIHDAIATYQQINSLKPRYAMAYVNLASAHICIHQSREALSAYDSAINLRPLPRFYLRRALVYLSLSEDEKEKKGETTNLANAQKDFQRALEINPDYSDAHAGLARLHADKKEYQECIEESDKALSKKKSFEAYLWRAYCGVVLAEKNKEQKGLDEAVDDLEKAKAERDTYSDPSNREDSLAKYYDTKSYIYEYRATYFLKEKYLKNKSSANRAAVMTELQNAKSATDQAIKDIKDKDWDVRNKKRRKQIGLDISRFNAFAGRG